MPSAFIRRSAAILLLQLLIFGAFAQSENLFRSLHPDVAVVVKKPPLGADLVEMTFLNGGYPPELAQKQVDNLAAILKSTVRGLALTRVDLGAQGSRPMLRANFGVDGLIDREGGVLRIEPIAKALAGAPSPYTVNGITIVFLKESPGPRTVKNLPPNGSVQIQGRDDDPRIGTEFRVKLLTQDATKISIPEGDHQASSTDNAKSSKATNDIWLWALIGVASIATGALVYSLLLQTRSGRPRRRRR